MKPFDAFRYARRAYMATNADLGHAAAHHITTGAIRPKEMSHLAQLFHDLVTDLSSRRERVWNHLPSCGCADCVELKWRGKILESWEHDGRPVAGPPRRGAPLPRTRPAAPSPADDSGGYDGDARYGGDDDDSTWRLRVAIAGR